MRLKTGLLLIICCLAPGLAAETADYHVIPFDIDPPVSIDGKLDDWADIPNVISLTGSEHATFGPEKWSGDDDLSGKIHLAWRSGGIFLAAEVVDDKVQQPYRGRDLYNGDHINLWMDLAPGENPHSVLYKLQDLMWL